MKATILILMAASGILLAQDQQGQGPPPRPKSPVFEALDVDKDGALSTEEITNASGILASLDTDDNGRLSKEETAPPKPEGDDKEKEKPRRGGPPPVDPVMASLDQNGDGTLSKREIARATKSLLELDEDESGKLEEEEMKPDEPTGGSGGEEGGPGGGGRPPHPPRGGR